MDACCQSKSAVIETLKGEHKRVLKAVLIINAALFVAEVIAGLVAHSTSLLADSLDALGDFLVYGFSLYVLWRGPKLQAGAAIFKGVVMAAFGFAVLAEAAYKTVISVVPIAETMGVIGLLALLGNGVCFLLLFRHRSDNLNMRSTWLCSRNDIIANLAVLLAAAGVAVFNSIWPDVLIGTAIAVLFLSTAFAVLRESVVEYRELRLVP